VSAYQRLMFGNLIERGSIGSRARKKGRVGENCEFAAISRYVSRTIQALAKVTIEREYEVICDLLDGVISTGLE